MSGRKSSSSAPAASENDDNTIELSYKTHCMYYAKSLSTLNGDLTVNDTNSPGGKRNTRLFTLSAVDMRGCTVLFEFWGPEAKEAEKYFRCIDIMTTDEFA